VFDRPVLGRCQLHKIRNVQDHLPEKMRCTVTSRMRRSSHAGSALAAEAELCALAAELDRTHPGAAASLREGMAETLTVLRLNLPPTLARTLRSTNAVESMISICRDPASNVKNWRGFAVNAPPTTWTHKFSPRRGCLEYGRCLAGRAQPA